MRERGNGEKGVKTGKKNNLPSKENEIPAEVRVESNKTQMESAPRTGFLSTSDCFSCFLQSYIILMIHREQSVILEKLLA